MFPASDNAHCVDFPEEPALRRCSLKSVPTLTLSPARGRIRREGDILAMVG